MQSTASFLSPTGPANNGATRPVYTYSRGQWRTRARARVTQEARFSTSLVECVSRWQWAVSRCCCCCTTDEITFSARRWRNTVNLARRNFAFQHGHEVVVQFGPRNWPILILTLRYLTVIYTIPILVPVDAHPHSFLEYTTSLNWPVSVPTVGQLRENYCIDYW